jgi:hypothetical protein
MGGQRHSPASLPQRRRPCTRFWRVRKISPPPSFEPPDRPARSRSPCRLGYPGRRKVYICNIYHILILEIESPDGVVGIVARVRDGPFVVRISAGATGFLFSKTVHTALGPTQPPIQWVHGFLSRGSSDRGVKLTTHLRVVPRLWMSGDEPRLSLCAFMAWAGKTLSFVTYHCSSNAVAVQILFHYLILNLFFWTPCSVPIYCEIYSCVTWEVIIKGTESLKIEYNSRLWVNYKPAQSEFSCKKPFGNRSSNLYICKTRMIVLQVGNYSVGFPPNEKWVSRHCSTLHQPVRKIPEVQG